MAGTNPIGPAAGEEPGDRADPGALDVGSPGGLAAVVLAAGAGNRLRPLTTLRPKPLCPVGTETLLDRALAQVGRVTPAVAVNLHHGRDAIEAHLASRPGKTVFASIEEREALGTAGAMGHLRPWIDGRGALVVNADGWSDADLTSFVAGWDGERIRLLVTPPRRAPAAGDRERGPNEPGPTEFGPRIGLVASLLPWAEVARLEPEPSGLFETMWRPAHDRGRLDLVAHPGTFVDCGTPADYLRANLLVADRVGSSDRSILGAGAVNEGSVVESVVWPGSHVARGERLVRAIRAGTLTIAVR